MTTILQARRDPQLLGTAFPGDTWAAHDALLAGAFGLPMDDEQAALFRTLAQRDPPPGQVAEYWLLAGRRAGKDQIAALIACYLAAFRRWPVVVGEVPTVLVLAADRDQARVAYNRIRGMLDTSPVLAHEVVATTADRITLASRAEIQIGTSDYRAVRGRSLVAVIADEICFWRSDTSASPDSEVIAAVRPALATMPGSMLVAISSPYSQRGIAFEQFRRYHGTDDAQVLIVRAETRALNPTVPQHVVDQAIARDPQAAAAEWLAQWRSDLESFLDAALVDGLTRRTPREIPYAAMTPQGGHYAYFAGVDVSGGRGDAAACAIARLDGDRVQIVAVRRWPSPHDPLVVAEQVAAFLREYHLLDALADQYAAEFSTAAYRAASISLRPAPVTRSEAYMHLLPLATSGRIEWPADPVLRTELLGLERRTARSGRDSVDHAPGAHDDAANAVALAAYAATAHAVLTPQELQARVQAGVVHTGIWDDYADPQTVARQYAGDGIFDDYHNP